MKIEISARKRETPGHGREPPPAPQVGQVPGIVYGGGQDAVNIELDHKDLYLKLEERGASTPRSSHWKWAARSSRCCCARNMHPFKPQVQHVDFQRVTKDRKIHMKVPLHFVERREIAGREGRRAARAAT